MKNLSENNMRMFPTEIQKRHIDFQFKAIGTIYNHILNENMFLHEDGQEMMTKQEMMNEVMSMRHKPEFAFIKMKYVDMQAVESEIDTLSKWVEKNRAKAKRKTPDFPLFKLKNSHYKTYEIMIDELHPNSNSANIGVIKNTVRISEYRGEPLDKVPATVLKFPSGIYKLVINTYTEEGQQ